MLAAPSLDDAEVAVVVLDVETGQTLFERGGSRSMVPASNQKLLTTAAAVWALGHEHLFVTRVLASGHPDEQGRLSGDLVIEGTGDPCLRADALADMQVDDPAGLLAELIAATGVRAVEGGLVLDDGAFDREFVHPDWEPIDLRRSYGAPVGALSLDLNCVSIVFDGRGESPRAWVEGGDRGYRVDDRALQLGPAGSPAEVDFDRPDESSRIVVQGRIGAGRFSGPWLVPVRDPTELFGRTLLQRLRQRGVTFGGEWRRDPDVAEGPTATIELARFETPLDRPVLLTNKESDNSAADHLLKALGAATQGEGSFAAGGRAIHAFLSDQVGVDPSAVQVQDGSGLARSNRLTARVLAETLAFMARGDDPRCDLFLRSLPVAGIDGSLHERLTESAYRGAVRAKTGYISGVSSLSGLAWTRSGRVLSFSILFNGFRPKRNNPAMKGLQDRLCRELVDHG